MVTEPYTLSNFEDENKKSEKWIMETLICFRCYSQVSKSNRSDREQCPSLQTDFVFNRKQQVVSLSAEKYFSTSKDQLAPIRIGGRFSQVEPFIKLSNFKEHGSCCEKRAWSPQKRRCEEA